MNDSEYLPFVEASDELESEQHIAPAAAPWMISDYDQLSPLEKLHCEILDICRCVSLTEDEKKCRDLAFADISKIIHEVFPTARIEIFGSHLTNILTPSSDLDIAVLNDADVEEDPLVLLAAAIRTRAVASYLEVISNAKVPIIKLDHIASGVSIDILYNNDSGVETGMLAKEFAEAFPPIAPLTLLLKVFLMQRKLNDTYTGGLGSFVLCMMVTSFLQMRKRIAAAKRTRLSWNLGSLLLEFFHLYGLTFNYGTVGITVNGGGSYFLREQRGEEWFNPQRPNLLCIENPLQPDVDMGKNSYNMPKIRRSFELAYQVLLSVLHRPIDELRNISILSYIINPNDSLFLESRIATISKQQNSSSVTGKKRKNKK